MILRKRLGDGCSREADADVDGWGREAAGSIGYTHGTNPGHRACRRDPVPELWHHLHMATPYASAQHPGGWQNGAP